MTTGKALIGVLAGFTAGAVLGFLFAPEKGARLRRRIARRGEDAVDDLNDMIEERVRDLVEAVKSSWVKPAKHNVPKTRENIPA